MALDQEDIMTMKQFNRNVVQHLGLDYDFVIAITSQWEGQGKSTLAGQIGLGVDKKFDFRKNVLYSPTVKSMRDLIFKLDKYSVVDADEAIKILYKLKWGDRISIFLNQLYALCRERNLATVLPMPRITDFVEFFRNHKIKVWLHVVDRGTAVIFWPDWVPFTTDPWYLKENLLIVRKHRTNKKTVLYDLDEKISALSKCQNFVGILKFDDLPEPHKSIYKQMKSQNAYADMDVDAGGGVSSIHLFESAKDIIQSRNKFTKEWRGKTIVDLDRIMTHFGVGRGKAMQIKKITEDELMKSGEEFERIATGN